MKKKLTILTVLAMLAAFISLGGGLAQADTLYVGPAETYTTIQAAIDAASPGDTIIVAAGTYNENVVINKSLTLKAASSPVIDGGLAGPCITIGSNGVTIDGFEIKNGTNGIVSWDTDNSTIKNCDIHDNLNVGGNNGVGIMFWTGTSTVDFDNNTIADNNIYSNDRQGIYIGWLSWPPPTVYSDGNTIRGNTIYNNGLYTLPNGPDESQYGIQLCFADNNTIQDNEIYGHNTWWFGQAIYLFASYDNTVTGNNIHDNSYGINLWVDGYPRTIGNNHINCNTIAVNGFGMWNIDGAAVTVDAECNWWGSETGPTHSSNPGGSGDEVSDYVLYDPWLQSPSGPVISNITPNTVSIEQLIFDLTADIGACATNVEYSIEDSEGSPVGNELMTDPDEDGTFTAPIITPTVGVYTVQISATQCGNTSHESALLVVYDPSGGFVTGGGWIDSPPGAFKTVVFFNGFETDIDGWFTPARVMTGTNGIPSASGDYHAEATLDFTRWAGYNSEFPSGGYITSIDIYLDVDGGFANDTRFDWTSAISTPDNNHRRDFIFNGGYYDDATGPGAGVNRFVFSASNNAPGWPKNPGRDPIAITTTGWYTLQHRFFNSGGGVLAVDLSILDSTGNLVHMWTLSDPTDTIGDTVGGNRYGWFATNEFSFLAIDNSTRVLSDTTGKANFGFVSKYKKGAQTPSGNTEFVFKAADLNFHSDSYDWLVVTGSNYAKFKGTGTINGAGDYKFMLWAGDDDPDTFRIKIWWEDTDSEHVVYDNGMDQPIGGGSIVIHTSKK